MQAVRNGDFTQSHFRSEERWVERNEKRGVYWEGLGGGGGGNVGEEEGELWSGCKLNKLIK